MLLLDLMLPGLGGEEILRKLGPDRQMPVIIISAINEQQSKVAVLRMGADDYITKPFDVEEVAARIDIHLGRYRRPAAPNLIHQLTYKDIQLDSDTKAVTVNGSDVVQTDRDRIRSDHELRQAIANMSHDLRTPLTAIIGYTKLLEVSSVTDEKRQEYLSIIRVTADRLHTLIHEFFELSLVQSAEYHLNLEPT
ncbi:sensor histidine kinase [Paenibacillus dakarensis]|uniref:sensor histidine kinase n=1 Tax=Paenibacillus dakarensis TaxID=1527293 RepID=UPI000B1CEE64|nr:histidine kinase dimerization/phospho-acceptor domain-containing protein [Paenibacillus dakarensis]